MRTDGIFYHLLLLLLVVDYDRTGLPLFPPSCFLCLTGDVLMMRGAGVPSPTTCSFSWMEDVLAHLFASGPEEGL